MTIKIKKIIKVTVILILILIFLVIFYFFVGYLPFIKEQFAFDINYNKGVTHIINENFNVSFDINEKCKLNAGVINYLAFKGNWLGELECANHRRISIYIWKYDQDLVDRRSENNNFNAHKHIIVSSHPYGSPYNLLTVIDKDETKIFDLGILGEDELFEEIVSSLHEDK